MKQILTFVTKTLVLMVLLSLSVSYITYADDDLIYIPGTGWIIFVPNDTELTNDNFIISGLGSYYSYDRNFSVDLPVPVPATDDVIHTAYGVFRFTDRFIAEATAYSPEQPYLSPYTYSGLPFTTGIVAVDPAVITLGTYIYVPGFGLFLAADTGGAIIGYTVDLSFDTIREALQFGRREVTVYVLDKFTDLF